MPGALANTFDALLKLYSRVAPTGRGGYRLARLARRFHPREAWRSAFTTPDHLQLELDLATYPDCCMAYGLYELETARLIKRLLRPGDHFVDGGANIGYFTLLAAQRVGPHGRVDAFEPQPENRARLEANLRVNALSDGVRLHAQALADRAGEAALHILQGPQHNHGEASLFAAPGAATMAIATARLDEVLAGLSPRLIKLDIEGAEPLAIAGMAGLLQGTRPPMVLMEHNAAAAARAGFAPTEALDRLLKAQPCYHVYRIGWRLRRIEPTPAVLGAMGQVNLLLRVD